MPLRNPSAFFASARATLFRGVLVQGQVAGMNRILAAWDALKPGSDIRFVAYSLATAAHDTSFKMLPAWGQFYYGRGLVQNIWFRTFPIANEKLHELGVLDEDQDLERYPDLALKPDISAAILVLGMTEGWFTGVRLRTYFNPYSSDWLRARAIINGTDCAAAIAGYGEHFRDALQLGSWS